MRSKRRRSRRADVPARPPGVVAYFVGEAVGGVRRNGLMSLAAVTTVMVVLLTVGGSVLVGANLAHVADALEADVQVIAFLRDTLPPDAVTAARQHVAEISGVSSVRYVSRAEALARLRRGLGGGNALGDLSANPLPDSLEVRITDPQQAALVAGALRAVPGIEDVTYGAQVTDRLLALTHAVRILTALAALLLGTVAVVVVVNTIRLTVIARRQEIEIMGLVGATRWFIRWPFLIEGMLQGILAAGASATVLVAVYAITSARLSASLPFLPLVPIDDAAAAVAGVLLIGGLAVGTAGSAIAIRRFLTA